MKTRRTVSPTRMSGLVLVTVAWALFLALTGSPEAILFTVPVFLLAAPLALGKYVGEEALVALRTGPRRHVSGTPAFRFADAILRVPGRVATGSIPGRGPPAIAS